MLGKNRGDNIKKSYRNKIIRKYFGPVRMAAQTEAWVCSRSLAGIEGFYSRRRHGCSENFVSSARALWRRTDYSSTRVLPSKCLSVTKCNNDPLRQQ